MGCLSVVCRYLTFASTQCSGLTIYSAFRRLWYCLSSSMYSDKHDVWLDWSRRLWLRFIHLYSWWRSFLRFKRRRKKSWTALLAQIGFLNSKIAINYRTSTPWSRKSIRYAFPWIMADAHCDIAKPLAGNRSENWVSHGYHTDSDIFTDQSVLKTRCSSSGHQGRCAWGIFYPERLNYLAKRLEFHSRSSHLSGSWSIQSFSILGYRWDGARNGSHGFDLWIW